MQKLILNSDSAVVAARSIRRFHSLMGRIAIAGIKGASVVLIVIAIAAVW